MKMLTKLFALTGSLALLWPASADVYTYRTVVKTGDTAPGTIGGTFTEFGTPSINALGQVAFTGKTSAVLGNSGMWMKSGNAPGSLHMLVGTNYPVPGQPAEVRFGDFEFSFYHPVLTDAGNVGIAAPVKGLFQDQVNGIFRRIDGTLSTVALPGDPAPGIGGATFGSLSNLVNMNEGNLMAFKATIAGQNVNDSNNEVLYMHWFGGLNLLKREGLPVPGVPGATFGGTNTFYVQIGNNGRVAFNSQLNINGESVTSHWTGWPGALTLIAKGGDETPIDNLYYTNYQPSLSGGANAANGYAFVNPYGQNAPGLWYYNTQTQTTTDIAYLGQIMGIGVYNALDSQSLCTSADGTSTYRAGFVGPGIDDDENSAFFRRTPGQPTSMLAREGDAPYGYWAGVEFDDHLSVFSPIATIIDDANRAYFKARVRGLGVNDTNNEGFWAVDEDGEVHFVIRRGQWITLEDGVSRQVLSFYVSTSTAMHAGRRPGVNNNGDIAMRVHFTDGTSAIVVAELPKCIGDFNNDGQIGVPDLLILLASWGQCMHCDEDLTGDDTVGVPDLLQLLALWGPCP